MSHSVSQTDSLVRSLYLAATPHSEGYREQREFFIDNLLVRIHFIIVMIRWTGLAPWEFEIPFSDSLTSTFLGQGTACPDIRVSNVTFASQKEDKDANPVQKWWMYRGTSLIINRPTP